MSSIVKYFLCSEHFTSGCFADPPYNTRLKKTTRPEVSIPIPSIFENNINKYIPKNVQLNAGKSDTIEDISFSGNDLDECYNCEVPSDVHFMEAELPDINHSGIAINGLTNDHAFVDINTLDTLSDPYDFIIEDDHIEQSAKLEIFSSTENTAEVITVPLMCRLCAAIFTTGSELSHISSISGLEAKLNSLLPNLVSINDIRLNFYVNNANCSLILQIQCGDDLSQLICKLCLDKVNECINTVDNFRKIQFHLRRNAEIE